MDVKKKIERLLSENPQGLTIKDITRALDISKGTAIKYLFELKGEGKLVRRRVGSGILYYLSNVYTSLGKRKESLMEDGKEA